MTIWNQIVTAVYRNEWLLVEAAVSELPNVMVDDSNNMAEVLGHIVAERLRANDPSCLSETVTWLLRQPYINRERFAEWVAMDALKSTSTIHQRTYAQVAPYCSQERLSAIAQHLTECTVQLRLIKYQTDAPSKASGWGACTVQ